MSIEPRVRKEGQLAPDIVAIGPFWTSEAQPVEIDAIALAGRAREAVLVGECKWARRGDARRTHRELERKAEALPKLREPLQFAVGAREAVERRARHPADNRRRHLA